MKFLCEHCKAKYQIADEKVVGRTVRMKCRKCGGAIEVRAAVTETSVSVKASEVAPETGSKPAPPRAPPPRANPLATSLSSSARTAGPASPLAGAFQRNVQREDEATSAGFDVRELSAADEWYVAVNGVPVGPVRVGEVRRKAAMGAVTEESLCWQEGMEEWRAIRTVTELAAVVREAASGGGRASQIPPEPRNGAAGRPPPPRTAARDAAKAPAAPAWAARASTAGMEAQRAPEPVEEDAAPTIVGRSPLLELEAAALASSQAANAARTPALDPFRSPAPPKVADPFAPPAADPFAAAAAVAAPIASGTGAFAAAVPASVAAPFAPPAPIVVAAPRRLGPTGIGVIVAIPCFVMMATYLFFTRPQAPIVVNVPAAPAAAAPPPTAAPAATTAATAVPAAEPVASAAPAGVDAGPAKIASAASPRTGGGGGSTTAGKATTAAATDPGLRDLIAGTSSGPAAGPGGGGGGGGGGGAQLTEDEVKSVVSQHSLGVKRTCWDRSSTTTASVNVTVHVVVGSSGQVTQASATGNDPVVAHCLEDEIRRWHWPGGGEVNVPFHFLRQ